MIGMLASRKNLEFFARDENRASRRNGSKRLQRKAEEEKGRYE